MNRWDSRSNRSTPSCGSPRQLDAGLTVPLPIAVICHMLGILAADRDRFTGWIDVALALTAFSPEEIHEAFARLKDYVAELVAELRRLRAGPPPTRRTRRGTGHRGQAERGRAGRPRHDPALRRAGTTTNHLGNAILTPLTHPGALRADGDLLDGAIDELLRFVPLVTSAGFTRIALADEELSWRRGRMVRGLDRLPVVW